jgi:type IV secretion system protein VirB2
MSLVIKRSLLDTNDVSSLDTAAGWMTGLLSGSLGVSLAVLAVAIVGFGALSGRLSLRRGGQTIIGVFVLFGASTSCPRVDQKPNRVSGAGLAH